MPSSGALVATGSSDARAAAPSRSPGRDHHPVGIGSGRVEQLDLDADDRVQPHGLGRPDEAHRAVQTGVVGDGQPGQPQLDGPLDQVVRRRGAVEEREVRVAVQFRVRGRGHETLRIAGLEGACQYRTSVLSRYARFPPGPTAGGQRAAEALSCPGATEPHSPRRHDLARAPPRPRHDPARGPGRACPGRERGHGHPPAHPRHQAADEGGLRLPPLLAARQRDRGPAPVRLRLDDRLLRPRDPRERQHRHLVGRLQGVRRRRRRGRHQRGP